MKTEEQLRQFYRSDLRSALAGIESLRAAARRQTWITALCGIGGAIAIVLAFRVHIACALLAVAGLGSCIYFGIRAHGAYTRFRDTFKQSIIAPVVAFLDPGFSYAPDRSITQSRYMASEIFKTGVDRYRGDDYVFGKLGDTEFMFSELHTEYKTQSTDGKGHTRTQWHTIFKGLFFCADFNKHFKGKTIVLPDTAERLFGFLGAKLQSWNLSRDDLVQLEDVEFEKEFVVYGSDQVEARYILSPSLMLRILEFKKKAGRKIHLSFVDSWVNLAISFKRDLFEANLFGKPLSYEKILEYFNDLQLAIGIVEELRLNTRIWTKS